MRYEVVNENLNNHCRFVATVVDTSECGRTICECPSLADAEQVAGVLNATKVGESNAPFLIKPTK